MAQPAWHTKAVDEIIAELRTDITSGLPEDEAWRLEACGPNALPEKARPTALALFLSQFNDFIIWVLVAAALVSGLLLRELTDTLAIVAILLLNAVLGFTQEYRAEQALDALKKLTAPQARVVRGGVEERLPARDLVPGDIILIEGGDIVPADARLVSAGALLVGEAALTGESETAAKTATTISDPNIPIGDRDNMVYLGTIVSAGHGRAVVVATGLATEMGRIAELIQGGAERTPLQTELNSVGRGIAVIVIAVAAIVFVTGLLRGFSPVFMFLASVSLAVAAIPEGLPAIVTVTLALSVQAMAQHNAIVRRLSAVETLGATTVICTDKTGTLTQNRMTVERIYVGGHMSSLADGHITGEAATSADDITKLLTIATLCNDAHRIGDGKLTGDPTETALISFADALGQRKELLEIEHPRVGEIPFDSERKRMTTINRDTNGFLVLTKGAPEVVLSRCEYQLVNGHVQQLSAKARSHIIETTSTLSSEGYRNLALAYKTIDAKPRAAIEATDKVERDLVFAGLISMADPPRPEVATAIKTTQTAGMHVVMVTGDHKLTARAIAERIGLLDNKYVLTGAELGAMDVSALAATIENIAVLSRVNPEDKVKIVQAFKQRGDIVAMTGDGVNDAPAVKKADVGIAMGKVGTDVTKEASDVILADDNFATIVAAVRQGRLTYDNLKKFILFLLSCNASEVFTVFIALMIGLPVPLLPVQILLTNLITDGFPALALGVEPPAGDLMRRQPRRIGEGILSRPRLVRVIWQGFVLTIGILGAFVGALIVEGTPLFSGGGIVQTSSLSTAQTVAFTTMVAIQLLHSLNYRTAATTLFSREVFLNRYLLIAIAGSFALQLVIIYVPFLQSLFNTRPLGVNEWLVVLAAILPAMIIIDVTKTRNSVGRF
ncbi:MAG TPA: cation-translocating P-type ATPase [Candidatus Aquicultor sp.]|jgi:Ca2+-transporting ATPase